MPIVTLPIANHDDNQHAVDENLRVQNLRDGIAMYAEVLAGIGARGSRAYCGGRLVKCTTLKLSGMCES